MIALDEAVLPVEERAEALVALDEALHDLEALDPRLGQVVQCRFFGGLTEEETREVLGGTARTLRRGRRPEGALRNIINATCDRATSHSVAFGALAVARRA